MLGKVWLLNVWASWCVAVPRRASAAGASSRARASCRSSASTTRTSATTRCRGSSATAIPTSSRSSTRDGRVGIDYGVYGVPETFVIDSKGVIRYKHIGPLTPEVAQKKIAPLVEELSKRG